MDSRRKSLILPNKSILTNIYFSVIGPEVCQWPRRKSSFGFKLFCRDGWNMNLRSSLYKASVWSLNYVASSSVFVVLLLQVTLVTQQLFP